MSILDGLIFGIRKLFVNGVEQPLKTEIDLVGAGVTVSQVGDKNVVSIAGTGGGGGNLTAEYALGTADGTLPNARVLTGTSSVQVSRSTPGALAVSCVFGSTAGQCTEANDYRLSNARTPTAHATSHKNGGTDEIAATASAAYGIPKALSNGKLHIGWIPVGITDDSVCLGTDARVPATTPTASTAGQCVMSNGSRVVYRGDVGRWWRLNASHTTTALATDTVVVSNAAVLKGQPVRILDMTGIYTQIIADLGGDASPVVKSGASITGVTGLILDSKGALHFKLVLVSGSTYRFDIHNDVECLSGSLVGHTAGFVCTTTGDQTVAVTADNGSGLGGNLVITTDGSVKLGIRRIQYLRTGVITGYSREDGQLNFKGQLVTTNPGAITELWLGAPEMVVALHGQIVGAYAAETTNTALLNRNADSLLWPFGPATLVDIRAKHLVADTGATQPKMIPIINGSALVADESAYAMTTNFEPLLTNSKPQVRVIELDNTIELRTIAGTNGNARNAIFDIIGVLD